MPPNLYGNSKDEAVGCWVYCSIISYWVLFCSFFEDDFLGWLNLYMSRLWRTPQERALFLIKNIY